MEDDPFAVTEDDVSVPPQDGTAATARERLFERIVGRASELISLAEAEYRRYVYVSPSHEAVLGYTTEQLLDVSPLDLVHPEDRLHVADNVDGVRREYRLLRADGSWCWVEGSGFPIGWHGRTYLASIAREVSERRRAAAAVHASQRRLHQILESITDGFFALDDEDRFTYVNRNAEALLERSREALLGRVVWDAFAGSKELAFYDELRRVQREGYPVDFEAYYPGLAKWFGVHIYPFDGGGAVYFRDVTERRRLEKEITRIAEEERQRIGQTLHDGLGAHLTGLAMISQGLAETVRTGQPLSPERLEYLARLASEGAEQARTLARGLNPVSLGEHGLETALRELSDYAWTTARVRYALDYGEGLPALDSDVETQLYWIVHEAVTNVLRHAGAERVRVRLRRRGEGVALTVDDDGSGPSGEEGTSEGSGLRIMKHRAHRIGARFRYERSPLGGVRIACVLPRPGALVAPSV